MRSITTLKCGCLQNLKMLIKGVSRMRWIVRVALTMDDVKECHFTDKGEALKYVEALKKLSMAIDAIVWMEEIDG